MCTSHDPFSKLQGGAEALARYACLMHMRHAWCHCLSHRLLLEILNARTSTACLPCIQFCRLKGLSGRRLVQAIAERFAMEGATIHLAARTKSQLEEVEYLSCMLVLLAHHL